MALSVASSVNNKGYSRISSLSMFYTKVQVYQTGHNLCEPKFIAGGRSGQGWTTSATNLACCRLSFAFLCGYQQFVEFWHTFSFRSVLTDVFDFFLTGSYIDSMNFDFSMILLIHVDSDEINKLLIHWLEFVCIVVQHRLYLHAISLQAGLSLKFLQWLQISCHILKVFYSALCKLCIEEIKKSCSQEWG